MAQTSEAVFVPVPEIGINDDFRFEAQPAEPCQQLERQIVSWECFEEKYLNIIRESTQGRYKLLPYLYTCFEQSTVPMLRSSINNEEEGRWYDYYTKREMPEFVNKIGCFIKGGNIIPTFDVRSYVKSTKDAKESNISLYVAVDEENAAKGKMFFDDKETSNSETNDFARKIVEFENGALTWKGEEETSGYTVKNRVTRAILMGLNSKVQHAYLVEEGKSRQKVQLIKSEGYVVLEFVALASKDWKIVLE